MSNTSFLDLKKSRHDQIAKLSQQLSTVTSNTSRGPGKDDRMWEPTVDKAGNGHAVIRFLPAPKGEEVPFVRVFTHGFKGPTGSWYIENSLTTLGQADPVSEMNTKLWNSGLESDKKIVRERKRKLNFYSNILVIKDPENPSTEGKVFLYRYGKKIFDKLNDLMNPSFGDEKPINPFDLWEGANFKLRIRNVEGYRNFDKSDFEPPSAISDDDKLLQRIWDSQYSLQEFLNPSNFKSYQELQTRLNRVLGINSIDNGPDTVDPSAAKQKSAPQFNELAVDEDEDFEQLLQKLKE